MPQPPSKPVHRPIAAGQTGAAATLARGSGSDAPKPTSNTASKVLVLAGVFMVGALLYSGATSGAKPSVVLPAPAVDLVAASTPSVATAPPETAVIALATPIPLQRATAVFAGGCFWGVQAVFQHTQGVLNAVSGYAGGNGETANYGKVSSGKTGHAEAVAITYDPKVVSYGQLLQIFFSIAHDPTEVDRQGPDYGPQYRSVIFYASPDEQRVAQQYIAQLDTAAVLPRKVATTVTPLTQFYPAEDEHQDYATRNPHSIYISTYDQPKITQFQKLMPERFREQPLLVAGQASR